LSDKKDVSDSSRLHPYANKLLNRPVAERIISIEKEKYIPYRAGKELLKHFRDLYERADMNIQHEIGGTWNMTLIGEPGVGKTLLLTTFASKFPRKNMGDYESIPVLYVVIPPSANRKELLAKMVFTMTDIDFSRENSFTLMQKVRHYIGKCEVRLVIFDEIHNIFNGSHRQISESLAFIKNLAEELNVSVILAGTTKAEGMIISDKQLESRFPIWKLDRFKKGKAFRHFLSLVEATLPLSEPSNLSSNEISKYLYDASGGLLRPMLRIIRNAAVSTVRAGGNKITIDLLKRCEKTISEPDALSLHSPP
jgi:replication-associated recombination protein RarA